MKILRILDQPAGDHVERERLQARAALFLTKLYFDQGAFSARGPRRMAGLSPTAAIRAIISERPGATPSVWIAKNVDRLEGHGYSITLSALASADPLTVSPRIFAVFKLMASSKRLGCRTGISEGRSPRSTLSTNSIAE